MIRRTIFCVLMGHFVLVASQSDNNFAVDPKRIHLVEQAWKINTSGDRVTSYYSIKINNRTFPGIRPFEFRWNMFKDALDYTNKNILELGCCTALPSTLLKKYKGAARVVAADMASYRLEAAQLFAKAFDVDIDFYKLHLDTDKYEEILGYDFDVAFCMSLFHWVKDKERLMRYLSHFEHVIYEGHGTLEIERFKKHGFDNYEVLGASDNGRPVVYFYK
ncbi:MAG: class I SAM-dependent methyltransferase [Candidatus Babeliales bacterium]|nr:class I SAM-dependent methyltransferase [Candidatus Babeliales bacterium]